MNRTRLLTTSMALLLLSSVAFAQGSRGRGRGRGNDDKRDVSAQEQQQRIDEQRRRDAAYQEALTNQVRAAQQAAAALQQEKRAAQYTLHQQYLANLQQQQERLRTERAQRDVQRDAQRDLYYGTPMSYRYRVSGADRQTNQFGADMLRGAVNNGYEQGWKAGRADRSDRWPSNYQKSYAYQDANYGYDGNYIPQSDYNYYFRQGFRRGYDDGYGSRAQYGTVVNGSPSMLSAILSGILGLQTIR